MQRRVDELNGKDVPTVEEVTKPSLMDVVKTLYTRGKEVASKLFSQTFFNVAQTPQYIKDLGLNGDRFTIRYGVIARHFGKDAEHTFSPQIWEQLPEALQHPFAITKYYKDENKQQQKGYRLYTTLRLDNGSYIVVGAEVKNSGRDIEVNSINTIFGRNSISEVHDELIYVSKNITPEQQSLLNGNNPHQYPDAKELSTDKDTINIPENQTFEEKSASLLIRNTPPKGVAQEKWDVIVARLRETLGADNVITDIAEVRRVLDEILDAEGLRAMKTSKGEVYGFTYNGKIYLDPTTLNLEAPIHEYTELWCSVIEKQDPALWAKGVELLKQTNTWEVVNSDPNYRNLSEDLRASETLSRIVAAEAAKKISEVSDSKTLIAKLRAWIRKFWNELKATFSQWTKEDISKLTLREFKAMPFRDLIEGVDPRKYQVEGGNALAASVDVVGDNSLVAIHNISGSKLAKALKQGGLANPSAAVIDIAKQSHEGYGEYSFILPKNLVAKKSGKNLGTYDRDAWTPLYPTVIYSHNKTSKANLNKLVGGLDEGLADKIKREVMMKVEGNGYYSGLQIVFLKDKGVEVPIATVTPRYAGTIEDLQSLFGDKEVTYDNYKALDQDAKNAVTIWIKARGNKADIERINGLMEQWSHNPKLIKSYTEEVGYGQFDNLLYGLQADARNSGNPDYGKTIENAVEYIRENNLQEEFDVWETAVISNLGFDEKIQVGWSPSGDRIMRKNTLENVSAYMRKQGKNASSDHWSNSEGKMLAKLAQNFATLEQIRANKHRLLSDVDSTMEIRRRMNQAAQIFMDFSKNSNLFLEEQSAYAYLEDILIGGMNPDKVVAEYNKATKRNISLTEEQKAELKELREDMNNIPVQYFETKFDRPVMFSEFAAVVAPNNMPEVIENQLREAGLNIYKYDPDVEGDRREQTLKATASDSIRFMFLGEKGTTAMDAAEEATTRLDNLAVAREMENSGNDALSIKQATGWERGADQMWRYEVPDVVINQTAELVEDGETLTTTLGSLVLSDELFNAYPELRDTKVIFKELPEGRYGSYAKGKNDAVGTIILSDVFVNKTENPQWVEAMREVNAHPLVRQWNRIAYAEAFDPAAFDKANKALRQSPIWEKFLAC